MLSAPVVDQEATDDGGEAKTSLPNSVAHALTSPGFAWQAEPLYLFAQIATLGRLPFNRIEKRTRLVLARRTLRRFQRGIRRQRQTLVPTTRTGGPAYRGTYVGRVAS